MEAEATRSNVEADDKMRIPLSTGRIWLADNEGNVRRAIAWTWPILNRREPLKYRWWMNRIDRAREPTPEALADLKALNQASGIGPGV